MLAKPDLESKKRFASWFLISSIVAVIAYVVFCFLAVAIGSAIIGGIVSAIVYYYFYLCIKSYSKATDIPDSAIAASASLM